MSTLVPVGLFATALGVILIAGRDVIAAALAGRHEGEVVGDYLDRRGSLLCPLLLSAQGSSRLCAAWDP